MNANAHEWKPGTESLAVCIICSAEYEPGIPECPKCHVSLSVVRRCPECDRLVSAQHTRCVYCQSSFTHDLPNANERQLRPLGFEAETSPAARWLRVAVVSIGTFAFVFLLGVLFLRQVNRPHGSLQIVAHSHALHSAKLRRSPSYRSSITGIVGAGTTLGIIGVQANQRGRWMVLKWNEREVYAPAGELAAPLASDADGGATVLKFFLEGTTSAKAVEEAAISVDQYVESFPKSPHSEELRWLLAERMRAISRHGGAHAKSLRGKADEQYRILAASGGSFAARARKALGPQAATAGK